MTTFYRAHIVFLGLLFSLFLLQSGNVYSQDESKRIRLGEATTITFPSEPFTDHTVIQDQYGVNNENGFFQARFMKSNVDYAVQLGSEEEIEEFYQDKNT